MTWKTNLGHPWEHMELSEMGTGEVGTARFQKRWECGSSLPLAMSLTGGLGAGNPPGLSLGT